MWECSHIGGDRFAANVVVLPDSLYFGRVEPAAAPALLGGLDEGRIDLSLFRGRTSFSLAEQAVEHFVRREFDIDAVDGVIVDPQAADGSFPVRLADRLVNVRVKRRLVSIAEPLTCKGRPNQLVPTTFTVSPNRSLPERGDGRSDLVHGAADVVELGLTEVLFEHRQHAALLVEDEAVELVGELMERSLRRGVGGILLK